MDTIDFSEPFLLGTIVTMIACPTIWNILARLEYRTHVLTKLACGSKHLGCYMLAIWIFSTSLFRDYLFDQAVANAEKLEYLDNDIVRGIAGLMQSMGLVLVVTSFLKLGITGTYLGDYFGILMDEPVTSFPFNVTDDPMYNGSSLLFLGRSLWRQSLVGITLSCFVFFVYRVALMFEGPFTAEIYAKRSHKNQSRRSLKTD
eukprot:gb/GECH01012696.1/.p1 GENE.gb/GECH01012696.1/~~gb/GECH01012696.1/.p1  ORF type:complete len:202 (+),score=31.94 gb/GECH01012696.1/:1-606(+)